VVQDEEKDDDDLALIINASTLFFVDLPPGFDLPLLIPRRLSKGKANTNYHRMTSSSRLAAAAFLCCFSAAALEATTTNAQTTDGNTMYIPLQVIKGLLLTRKLQRQIWGDFVGVCGTYCCVKGTGCWD